MLASKFAILELPVSGVAATNGTQHQSDFSSVSCAYHSQKSQSGLGKRNCFNTPSPLGGEGWGEVGVLTEQLYFPRECYRKQCCSNSNQSHQPEIRQRAAVCTADDGSRQQRGGAKTELLDR
jgi:hypothetical protein